jgi:aspartyl protease family protein
MRFLLLFAVAAVAIGAFVPKLYAPRAPATTSVAVAAVEPAPQAGSRSAMIQRGSDGHFKTEATIDGRRVDMLVDTGASLIALRQRDAMRMGINPASRDYTANVVTANGTVKAARVELGRVEVGGVTVRDVAAVILPDEALSQNLLGMSFLSKLRWEQKNGRLVLEQ